MRPIDRIPGMSPTRREEKLTDGGKRIYVKAPAFMGTPEVSVDLTKEQYTRYVLWRDNRTLIQEALPELSIDEREKLMSGLDDAHFHKATRGDE
jgi:hypothetical protein